MHRLEDLVDVVGAGVLEERIFGSRDSADIADGMTQLVAMVGSSVAGWLWYVRSVASVAGAVLEDGRNVVVRAYQPSVSAAFIDGVVRVQRHVANCGFPAPQPLSGPVTTAWGLGRVESLLADPGARRPGTESMSVSAAGLARVAHLAGQVDHAGLEQHPMAPTEDLYPEPHSPIFDFSATASDAEWIDAIAGPAKSAAEADDTVAVSHGDWSARNVRMNSHRVLCAYDWESLERTSESTALGVAAATWRSLGEADDPLAPDRAEIEHYIELYSQARPAPLTATQEQAAKAMAVYVLAYTARCEHALRPGIRDGRATGRLARDADALVDMVR